MPTEKEVEQERDEVRKLRRQAKDAQRRRAGNVAEVSREIESKRLAAEKERLQAAVEREKGRATKTAVREGNARVTEQVSDASARAESQKHAQTKES
jgi:hypothetical protein